MDLSVFANLSYLYFFLRVCRGGGGTIDHHMTWIKELSACLLSSKDKTPRTEKNAKVSLHAVM